MSEGADAKRKLARNERAKLSATFLNTLASAAVVVGVFGPIAAFLYGSLPGLGGRALVMFIPIWSLVGAALHLMARRLLGRLEP